MRVCILGGTGSLGSALSHYYYENCDSLTVFSRDPHKQAILRRELPKIRFVLGDICNYHAVSEAIDGNDVVINAAALKLVDQGDWFPEEYLRVNALGAQNVVQVSKERRVEISLLISTDKAVSPVNYYGITKAAAEGIYITHNYSVLRYGNVVGSRGSFVHIWREQLKDNKRITLRQPDPTRFFLTMKEAIGLVVSAIHNATYKDTFIPRGLKSFSILQDADALKINDFDTESLLPGEKQHEILLSEHEQGKIVNDLLCRVWKGYQGELNRSEFASNTALRFTAGELLERLKLSL